MQTDRERNKGRSCLRILLCYKKNIYRLMILLWLVGFFYHERVRRQIKTQQPGLLLSKHRRRKPDQFSRDK